jgi:two-component system, chemotaxis family, chemotaxis protein CheY
MSELYLPAPLPGLRILVIDDDAMVRSVLVDYLTVFGFTSIIEASSGEHALRIIRDESQRVDFVLSDWEMPDINGITILQALRKTPSRENTPFIMITSQSPRERQKIDWARKWRVSGYIVKPFRGKLLREKIWSVMGWELIADAG